MNHRGQRRHNILFTEPVLNRNIGFSSKINFFKKGFSAFLEAKGGCSGASNVVTEAGPGRGGGGGCGGVVTLAFLMRHRRSAALHLHYRRASPAKTFPASLSKASAANFSRPRRPLSALSGASDWEIIAPMCAFFFFFFVDIRWLIQQSI